MSRQCSTTHNGAKYTFDGSDIRRSGHSFQEDLSDYLPQVFKNGKPKKIAKWRRKKGMPQAWWSAQCSFRGLPHKGTIAEMKERLQGASKVMSPDVKAMKKKLEDEYSDPAKRRKWEAECQRRLEKKQNLEAARAADMLRDVFSSRNEDVVVLKVSQHELEGVPAAAAKLGLCCEFVGVPEYEWGSFVTERAIVGKTQDLVTAKIKSLKQEAYEARLAKERVEQARQEARLKTERDAIAQKRAAVEEQAAKGWDVTGTWRITCPYIAEQWNDRDDMELKIYRTTEKGLTQMFAEFNFDVVTGWFRFEDPVCPPTTTELEASRAKAGQKRKRADVSEDDSEDEDASEDDISTDSDSEESEYDSDGEKIRKKDKPDPNQQFYLRPQSKPSPKQATWKYRWRGEENGEGEIQVGEDEKAYSITFSGKGGTKLEGTFGSSMTGGCKFSGIKIEVMNPYYSDYNRVSINSEWKNRSERAWNRACASRW
ncbi:hypothetical protein ABW21_db0208008 [Orbilia brochopaga]|nr:hypothetical protein ABW21_db0208008 [Drechslerella brochopaga]